MWHRGFASSRSIAAGPTLPTRSLPPVRCGTPLAPRSAWRSISITRSTWARRSRLPTECAIVLLLWLEDPGPWNDAGEGLAHVARHIDIPVAAGENLTSIYACRDMIGAGGIRLLTPDLFGCGGFTGARKMAVLAEAAHIGVMLHGANFPELAAHVVSGVANGYLVAATPPSYLPEIWSRLYEDFALRGDRIELSERPGLGLTLDSAYLDPTVVST